MLTDYINAAMKRAHYDLLDDQPDAPYYGEIPETPGVWANAASLEACRAELQSVLEGWLIVSIRRNLPIPPIDGIDLSRIPDLQEAA
jgi:predicted RNase H-like HicB family nuclease